jgi:hypothetical protein
MRLIRAQRAECRVAREEKAALYSPKEAGSCVELKIEI